MKTLHRITLSGTTTQARYSAYADDVSAFVKSKGENDEVSKEISWYEEVTRAKINGDESLACGWVCGRESFFPDPSFGQMGLSRVCVGSDLQLEKNSLEVREKAVRLSSRRRISLKGRANVCESHIWSIFLYRLSIFPVLCSKRNLLVLDLFHFLWGMSRKVRFEVCCFYPSVCGLGMHDFEILQQTFDFFF